MRAGCSLLRTALAPQNPEQCSNEALMRGKLALAWQALHASQTSLALARLQAHMAMCELNKASHVPKHA